jgi:NAD(P)H-hydrate repair Nnr-like enzyme with NAD(P)H-hydrate dehydratase domain
VLDAFALGVLPDVERSRLPDELVLSPNKDELGILLGRRLDDERADVVEVARRFGAVVGCYGTVAHPDGRSWTVGEGGAGLGTSGSGDVLAGAIAGFVARGAPSERAAVWGAWTHARAGTRLEERLGLGFLARDLAAELTPALRDTLESPD